MIETLILSSLVYNEGYGRKVMPFLKSEYFQTKTDKIVFELINKYVDLFNSFPNLTSLGIEAERLTDVNEDEIKQIRSRVDELQQQEVGEDWLLSQTEQFCKDRAIFNAISQSIKILDNKNGNTTPNEIPVLLEQALAVSFDSHIGHDFIDDADNRYDYYHKRETRIPFDIEYLNKITKGGLPKKSLNIVLAGTGVGKSLFMCHCAAAHVTMGKNVLYITMEMAEERIAERVDANLLNTSLEDLQLMPRDAFHKKIDAIRGQTLGKLIIKEYPTASAGSANFRHLLNELKLKKKFVPDIIYVDYLNICISSRLKQSANVNSYTYVKAIAEELRGLAVEFNVPIVSATQTTRSGYTSSDLGLEDTSESFGLPATADLMIAMIATEELQDLNQVLFKQLKNRYADPSYLRRFVVGVDRSKMRLYDVEQSAQTDVVNDKPQQNQGSKFDKEAFKQFT